MGGRQVVRHGSLEPVFVGSSPTRPALQGKSVIIALANPISFPPLMSVPFLELAPSSQSRKQAFFADKEPMMSARQEAL